MIARFRILLPFNLSVPQGDELPPHEFTHGEYRVRIYCPCEAAVDSADTETLSPTPLLDIIPQLRPADIQSATDLIRMDGALTIQANLVQIDFLKADFDRRKIPVPSEELEIHGDPPIQLGFSMANSFLARIRTVTRGSEVRPVSPKTTFWRLRYLTDNQEELPLNPELFRGLFGTPMSWRATGLNVAIWNKAQTLPPDFRPPTWDTLLLDARSLIPEVGPAVVLAYAALETFIEASLKRLASNANLPPGLWDWIDDREGDWRKQPSVPEQYDQLLRFLTNRSLKEENQLWEGFQNLRDARNSFTHQGIPLVGDKEVTVELATRLINRAEAIMDWVELLLPDMLRRPKLERGVTFTFLKMLGGMPVGDVTIEEEG